jgi:transposase
VRCFIADTDAVFSIREWAIYRSWSHPMSASGSQRRTLGRLGATSGTLTADIVRLPRHVRLVPTAEIHTTTRKSSHSITSLQRPICSSPHLYRPRNLIERFFNKIKQCRRVATRYDKLAANY